MKPSMRDAPLQISILSVCAATGCATPLFVSADKAGRDWVRWSMPRAVAQALGWGDMRCACCGDKSATGTEHAVEVDTALDEVDWWFKDNQPDSEQIRQAWVETLMLTPDEIPEFNEWWWRTRR
jgi:hypothetical protein